MGPSLRSFCGRWVDDCSTPAADVHLVADVTRTNCPSTEAEVNSFVDQILQEHPKDADFITALFYGSDCEVIRLVPLQVISDGCVHTYIDCVDFSHWVPGWTPDSPSVLSTSFHRPGDDSVRYIAVYERNVAVAKCSPTGAMLDCSEWDMEFVTLEILEEVKRRHATHLPVVLDC
ncbi:hypothetical protein HGRIS_001393 [Hohenbuehelia grisea]|uniref:Uncharacterized protein n=1 Tax=Hohenbuehelia grisea TaxID=104357 RepID=A0ABR3JR23_9AGAR